MTSNHLNIRLENRGFSIEPDETLVGFVSRLACSKSTSLRSFSRMKAVDATQRASASSIQKLASCSGVTPESLEFHAVRGKAGTIIFGHSLGTHATIHLPKARFCPGCIQEDFDTRPGKFDARPYVRAVWHVNLPISCPRHDTLIVSMSSPYVRGFEYDFHSHLRQRSDELRTIIEAAEVATATPFDHFLHRALDGVSGPEVIPIPDLDLDSMISVTEMIGYVIVYGSRGRIKISDPVRHRDVLQAGFEYTRDGYAGIKRFLLKCDEKLGRNDMFNPRHLYGALHIYLWERRRSRGHEVLSRFVGEHVAGSHALGLDDTYLGIRYERRYHSCRSAARAYGIPVSAVRSAAKALGFLKPEAGRNTDIKVPVENAEFTWTMEMLRDGMSAREVENYLGLGSEILRSLEPTFIRRRQVPGSPPAFPRHEIQSFLESLVERAQGAPVEKMVHLVEACRVETCTIADIIGWILEGRIRGFAFTDSSSKTFRNLVVDVDEVRSASRPIHPGLPARDVAGGMGVSVDTVYKMIEAGILETFEGRSHRIGRHQVFITAEAIADFHREYAIMSKRDGHIPFRHRKTLTKSGIVPAVDGKYWRISTVYAKSDLPADIDMKHERKHPRRT